MVREGTRYSEGVKCGGYPKEEGKGYNHSQFVILLPAILLSHLDRKWVQS